MEQWGDIVQWRTVAGESITRNGLTVTPLSRALIVRLSGGGFVWNRPLAVVVEGDGESRRVPIIDVTRLVQVGLASLTLVGYLVFWLSTRGRSH